MFEISLSIFSVVVTNRKYIPHMTNRLTRIHFIVLLFMGILYMLYSYMSFDVYKLASCHLKKQINMCEIETQISTGSLTFDRVLTV